MEISSGVLAYFGVKLQNVIAALIGSTIALMLMRGVTFVRALISFIVGFMTSVLGTPILDEYMTFSEATEHGISFILGVIGMNLVSGIFSMSSSFSKNPLTFLKRAKEIVTNNTETDSDNNGDK